MKILIHDMQSTLYATGGIGLAFDCDTNSKQEILQLEKGDYVLQLNKPTNKRSLNQNALLWELIGQIDIKENGSRADDVQIYVNILRMAGARVESISIKKEAFDEFRTRTSDVFREHVIVSEWKNSKGIEWIMVNCYYGSSNLNRKEMATVIDTAITYAESIGVPTEYYKEELKK